MEGGGSGEQEWRGEGVVSKKGGGREWSARREGGGSGQQEGSGAVLYPPRDNPYGIHGMGGGLQKFQMESMEWGMDSILLPWNAGWTPYIFKMDSMECGMDSILF